MKLAELQSSFMASVLDSESELPDGWTKRHEAGLSIYRGNYRSALIDALNDTYVRTRNWAGAEAFKQAAINHVIAHPSASWTIDDAGAGFDKTCAQFFSDAPEISALAWLEWVMLEAFSAPDSQPLDLAQFGEITSTFGEEQWINLRLDLIPDLSAAITDIDLLAMWNATMDGEPDARPDTKLDVPKGVFVWREDERATFQMVEPDEVEVLQAARAGKGYGEICVMLAGEDAAEEQAQQAAMRAGAILGRWVQEGLVLSLKA